MDGILPFMFLSLNLPRVKAVSAGSFPQTGRVVRVSGFVHAAQSALARGLFGNVVGPVKEFTD